MKNKLLSAFLAVVGIFSVMGSISMTTVSATDVYYDVQGGHLTFDKETGIITRYSAYASELIDVVIPNTIEGVSVTSIGNTAFYNGYNLSSINIPDSVTSIGYGAFMRCANLLSINIPNSVVSIGNTSFVGCTSLTSISIPNSAASIGDRMFLECSSLVSITVANDNVNYSSLDGVLFNKARTTLLQYPPGKNEGYIIPNSVTSIGDSAFDSCTSLTSITIPNSVTSIGNSAFTGCSSLTSITMPNSIVTVGNWAFSYCNSLTSVGLANSVTSIGAFAFVSCTNLTAIIIPNSVTYIGEWAFSSCANLNSITISDSITSIEFGTFSHCFSLKTITIPNGVKSIKPNAFANCHGLESAEIPNSVISIGYEAFRDCMNLNYISIPNNILSIESSTFSGCTKLESIIIPDNVENIGMQAFYGCVNLTAITIPLSVTFIDWQAFQSCDTLTIFGYSHSYAETYSRDNGIPFSAIGGSSGSGTVTPVKDITLTEYDVVFNGEPYKTVTYDVFPDAATKKSVAVTSDNDNVVKAWASYLLSDDTKQTIFLEPTGQGTATVSVKCESVTKYINITVNRKSYTKEDDILRKIALCQLTYYVNVPNSFNYNYTIPTITASLPVFTINGEPFYWNDVFSKTIDRHKIVAAWHGDYGFDAVAFEDENGEVFISFRGTEPDEDPVDLVEGAGYTLRNKLTSQFYSAYKFYTDFKKQDRFRESKITLIGHSLGGALAAYVSIMEGDVWADCFNDATGWIIDNVFENHARNIKGYNGIDKLNYVSYINNSIDHETNITNMLGYSNFNEFTAHTGKDLRNYFWLSPNAGYDYNKGMHGLGSLIKYESGKFVLGDSISDTQLHKVSGIKTLSHDIKKYIPSLILGHSAKTNIDASATNISTIYTGEGNTITTANNSNNTVVALGSGFHRLYGRNGNDTYVIDLNIADYIISDSSGSDKAIIKGIENLGQLSVSEDPLSIQYTSTVSSKTLTISKIRDSGQQNVRAELENGTGIPSDLINLRTLNLSDYTLKSLRLTGEIEVSVYDGENNLLGTHNNTENDVEIADYGYFYPVNTDREKHLDIDLINGNYTLKVTSDGTIGCTVYDPESPGVVCYTKENIDLSDGRVFIVNSDFINASEKFSTEKESVATPIAMTELVNVSQVDIDLTEINVKAGLSQAVAATISPSNAISSDVSWEVINPENKIIAVVDTAEGTNITRVTGVSEGVATLRATAVSGIYDEISIAVTQDSAPEIIADDYINGTYSEAESVRVHATLPVGYDTMYINGVETDYIDITDEGVTTIKAVAVNSATGEWTKTSELQVKIDRVVPTIDGVESNEVCVIDRLVTVGDTNIDTVATNGIAWTQEEILFGRWHSEVGNHEIIATDLSGKQTSISFEVKPFLLLDGIVADSLDEISQLRSEYEMIKYVIPEERGIELNALISALETEWILLTGQWYLSEIEIESNSASVIAIDRLGEFSEPPTIIIAVYDDTQRLLKMSANLVDGILPKYSIGLNGITGAKKVKAFLWAGIQSVTPLSCVSEKEI